MTQGISAAGKQDGMNDARSSLVKEIFRVTDKCPKLPGPRAPNLL